MDSGSPVEICVVSSVDVFGVIENEIQDTKVDDDHVVRVLKTAEIDAGQDCQILFVGSELGVPSRTQLKTLHRSGTVTVGDAAGFASGGGVIGFFREGTRIRFEINRGAAKEAGVRISSRLLRLAKLTKTED